MEYSITITINKPIQQVWDYVNNPDNMPLWLNDFVRYEHLTGDQNAPKVGDTSNRTYSQNGKEFVIQDEITLFDPPNRIELKLTSAWFDMDIVNNFKSVDDNQCELFAGAKSTRLSWMMKIIMFFSSDKKQQSLRVDQINKLKELIEAGPA